MDCKLDAHYSFNGLLHNIDNCFVLDNCSFDIGIRVIKWWEHEGFDGYDTSRVVSPYEDRKTGKKKVIKGKRYSKRRGGLKKISQFMIHHTGGDGDTPKNVFRTLHMHRGLSVHYAIDDDGRIWQFLDPKEKAWHGGKHNNCSIGIEGMLYPNAEVNPNYYSPNRNIRFNNQPHKMVMDKIHGQAARYFQFTEVQMDCMAKLVAGNWLALSVRAGKPVGAPTFPKVNGCIPHTVINKPLSHKGLIGHLQATRRKIDPAGFEWEKFEKKVADYYEDMVGKLPTIGK